jgi:hypothetical protein
MREQFRPVKINFASVDISGGPGLAVVAVVVAITLQFDEVRWLLLSGIVSGALVAAAMILMRRSRADLFTHAPNDLDLRNSALRRR